MVKATIVAYAISVRKMHIPIIIVAYAGLSFGNFNFMYIKY